MSQEQLNLGGNRSATFVVCEIDTAKGVAEYHYDLRGFNAIDRTIVCSRVYNGLTRVFCTATHHSTLAVRTLLVESRDRTLHADAQHMRSKIEQMLLTTFASSVPQRRRNAQLAHS